MVEEVEELVEGIHISIGTAEDGVVVVQIDTEEGLGMMRVNINDETISQGDPEIHDMRYINEP